jgi:hypothetical protein
MSPTRIPQRGPSLWQALASLPQGLTLLIRMKWLRYRLALRMMLGRLTRR